MDELLLRPLADAFLQVGVPVAVLVAAAAWAQVRYGTRALDVLVRHRRAAPLLGALLGVSPGCGGAILAAGLYLKGRASYGTAVAALTATMGDASFVLLAVDLRVGLAVHAVLLATGVLTGYLVDAVGWDPRRTTVDEPALVAAGAAARPPLPTSPAADLAPYADASPPAPHRMPGSSAALWTAAAAGSLLAAPAALSLLDPVTRPPVLLGVDLWLLLGVSGFVASLAVFLRAGCRPSEAGEQPPSDVRSALAHGAVEAAFVIVWVSAAFVVMAVLSAALPWDGSVLPLAGLVGVLVGVAVALVPGCGTQIAFTGLYASGALPLPALLANAVAQDGDALLPVLAQDRRVALLTTLLTSFPAVAVGTLALVAR